MNYNYDSANHEKRTLEFQSGLEQMLERNLKEEEFRKIAWLNGMGRDIVETFLKLLGDCYTAGINADKKL